MELSGFARAREELGLGFQVLEVRGERDEVIAELDRGEGPESARWKVVSRFGTPDLEPTNELAELLSGKGR